MDGRDANYADLTPRSASSTASKLSLATSFAFCSPPISPAPSGTPGEEVMFEKIAMNLVPFDRREFAPLVAEQARAAYHARFSCRQNQMKLEPWPHDAAYHIQRLLTRLLNLRIPWIMVSEAADLSWVSCRKRWMNQLIRDGCQGIDLDVAAISYRVCALYETNTQIPANDICLRYLCRYTFEVIMKMLPTSDQQAFIRRKEIFVKNFGVPSMDLGRVMLMLKQAPSKDVGRLPFVNPIVNTRAVQPSPASAPPALNTEAQDTDEVDA
jgi:hypothetical protein